MDDLIIFSNSTEDHQKHLTRLLEVLSIEKKQLSVEKCAWACQYVRFLGCIVGHNELEMDPKKARSIITMPCPKAQEEIRVFLRLTGFYRKHIDGYTRTVTPLANLFKRSKRRERMSPRVYGGRRNAEESDHEIPDLLTRFFVRNQGCG